MILDELEQSHQILGGHFWLSWALRSLFLILSMFGLVIFFSDWRHFPSVNTYEAVHYWHRVVFISVVYCVIHLLISMFLAICTKTYFKYFVTYHVDFLLIVLFLIGPFSLATQILFPADSTFSYGVSEGEIIRNNVVTELGHRYFFMQKMQEVFQMVLYLSLRLLAGLFPLARYFK